MTTETTSREALPDWDDADDYRSLRAARRRHRAYEHHEWAWRQRVDPDYDPDYDGPEPPHPSDDDAKDFARLLVAIGQRLKEMGINEDDDYDGPFYYDDDKESYQIHLALERHPGFQARLEFMLNGTFPDGWQEGTPDVMYGCS